MSRRRDEGGAVALMVAVFSIVVMGVAALVVDLGHARVVRRDMQALADVVALDLARHIDGRSRSTIESDPTWAAERLKSVERNQDTAGGAPVVTAALGTVDRLTGVFHEVPLTGYPQAVKVTASASVDFVFAEGSGSSARSAVATNAETACIALGSYAASIRSNNSALLAPLIGERLGVDLVSYRGLADISVSLLELAGELNVGSVDALADIDGISVGSFYVAVAEVLRHNGDTANASLLQNTIATNVSAMGSIDLGGLVTANAGTDTSAFDARVNVLDLVAGAAFLANGENFVSVPAIGVTLSPSGMSPITLTLQDVHIIQRPQLSCGKAGETTAQNTQIELTFQGSFAQVAVPNPGLVAAKVAGDITLDVSLAHADGLLTDINCKQGTTTNPDKITVSTTSTLLTPTLNFDLDVTPVSLLGIDLATVAAQLQMAPSPQTAAAQPVEVSLPPSVRNAYIGTTGIAGATVTGGATLTSDLLTVVTDHVLRPIATKTDTLVTNELRTALGVSVADVDVFGMYRPDCGGSALRGY